MELSQEEIIDEHENISPSPLSKEQDTSPETPTPRTIKSKKPPVAFKTNVLIRIILIVLSTTLLSIIFQNSIIEFFHFHLATVYLQPTVAIPMPESTFNFTTVLDKQKYEFESQIADFVKPFNNTDCKLINIGGIVLCENLLPKSIGLLNLGYKQEDMFGCIMSSNHAIFNYFYGCQNEHFPLCSTPNNYASESCFGEFLEQVGSKKYQTLQNIILQHKLENQHIIVKMIVKEDGWQSFRSLRLHYLKKIDQMILQFHIEDGYYWGNLDLFKTLDDYFYPINLHMHNQFCHQDYVIEEKSRKLQSSVFSVTYANKNLTTLKSTSRSFKVNKTVNSKSIMGNDCQMPYEMTFQTPIPISAIEIPNSQKKLHSLTREHIHLKVSYPYKTLGISVVRDYFQMTKIKQQHRPQYHDFIAKMFKPYNNTNCQYTRYGGNGDEGYVLCKNFLNDSVALLNLGISGSDDFGCELTSLFQIPNFQYDCTNRKEPYCRTNNFANVFNYACINERSEILKNEDKIYYSIKDIVDSRKLTNKRIIIKMDIEGGEWSALRSIPLTYLDYIDQIVVEMHLFETFAYFEGNIKTLAGLAEHFYPVNFHMNNFNCWRKFKGLLSSSVFELTLVNKNLLTLFSQSRSYSPTALNTPNSLRFKDCQIDESVVQGKPGEGK